MELPFIPGEHSRRTRLLVPIALMTLGGLALLVALAMFLVSKFDATAFEREQRMVANGFAHQVSQFQTLIVPQIDWDKAVEKLDHQFDPAFADINFGSQLYTFNGFTRTFFIDGEGRELYASVDGRRVSPSAIAAFRPAIPELIAPIRRAEADRPPIRPNPARTGPVTHPIQANAVIRAEGRVYLVIARLVQPDLGKVLPRSPRAPIAITAMPIDGSMLRTFAQTFFVDDLRLVERPGNQRGKAYSMLRGPAGEAVAALEWTPRQPGALLYARMRIPLVVALLLLGAVGWSILRSSGTIVDELVASERRAKHIAQHDPLTGLANRALLFEVLSQGLAAVRPGRALGVLCLDLDRFKEINDTLGHPAGDALIRSVSERLRAACPDAALIARLGGDEFVVLCPGLTPADAGPLTERCHEQLQQPIDSEFGRIEPSCSIGVALIEDPATEPSQALRWGDLALYAAKAERRGGTAWFDPAMDEAHRARRTLEADLRAALVGTGLSMVYQPQVDRAWQVRAVEALVRWNHPRRGAISPAEFVPMAEECGLIMAIGEFVLRRVFEETAGWQGLRVAINISPVQMRSSGFAALVMRLASRAGIDPSRYDLELTETALLGDDPVTRANFRMLLGMGFAFVLDDFGTGYSSLSLLRRFDVEKIKIDRSFVSSLGEGGPSETLVLAIVQLARTFNLEVIAEGVETEAQFATLAEAGCNEFQGYLTGAPVPGDVLAACHVVPGRQRRTANG